MKRRDFIGNIILGTGSLFLSTRLWAFSTTKLPNVLILGDSISIGYTGFVRKALEGKANVYRPIKKDGKAENCQGTTNGVKNLHRWLKIQPKWDVIHFNFGLHDLKHVDPITGKNSTNPKHPQQADLKTYKKQLKKIVKKLKKTRAQLVFGTITPFPDLPDGPLRHADQTVKYNTAALKIMAKFNIPINNLNTYVKPNMKSWQLTNNVHFNKLGSQNIAQKVTEEIKKYL
ncbi:SGNH/GDSL hydrolase family protein [Flagellimonas sp. CMM7]|uniref:SGNH/GDSL hydrolase family protein n=1 Tax=Flagellimonas sp. CMM7 TaxID=2654676 RepID=UPI0013D0D894|nr:SGNH/GDSL hydrolase family protein [Flagellimonas sp. CMM7]UII78743.1 SGNH/GDSL hydrolase family protein [Flagellimonas sp. CMM7]